MKIEFTSRGFKLSEELKTHTEAKMKFIKKLLGDVQDVSVVLTSEKYRHRAEIQFTSGKNAFHGQEETTDMVQSIDRVIEKLEKQVRRTKDKKQQRKRTPLDHVEMEELATEPHQEGDHEIKVIPAEPTPVKPLSLEDAAAELSKTDMGFLLFRNAESDCITVIYRRKDGHFSYIEAK